MEIGENYSLFKHDSSMNLKEIRYLISISLHPNILKRELKFMTLPNKADKSKEFKLYKRGSISPAMSPHDTHTTRWALRWINRICHYLSSPSPKSTSRPVSLLKIINQPEEFLRLFFRRPWLFFRIRGRVTFSAYIHSGHLRRIFYKNVQTIRPYILMTKKKVVGKVGCSAVLNDITTENAYLENPLFLMLKI